MIKLTPCELSPDQKEKWDVTLAVMSATAPGFRHLLYRLLANNDGDYVAIPTRDIPTACTDGKNIMINPDWMFGLAGTKGEGLGVREQVFVVAHEVVHNVYGDVELLHRCVRLNSVPQNDGTTLPFDAEVMQKSMDFRINALLVDSRIGKMPAKGCYDTKIATAMDSVLDVYAKCYKKKKQQQEGEGDGMAEGFDQVLPPGTSTGQHPDSAQAQRNQQRWQVEALMAQTLEASRAQGRMAGALQRMFQDLLEPEIPWVDHIETLVHRRTGVGGSDWRKPDRKFLMQDIHMPSRSGFGAGTIVIWGDTSGSIGETELNSYIGEMAGIMEEVNPQRLVVVWCDDGISHIDEVTDVSDLHTIRSRGVGGGGGTSFQPVLDWIEQNCESPPDLFIGFTDGCVSFPAVEPVFPTIWASTTDNDYPYGDVVRINKAGSK